MPRKKKLKAEQVVTALQQAGGVIAVAARSLGVARSTVNRYINDFVTVKEALDEANETSLDIAEAGLMQFVAGKVSEQSTYERLEAIKFYLRTKGRLRGYGDRLDVSALLGFDPDALTDDQLEKLAAGSDPSEVLR